MIRLTRVNGTKYYLNPGLIEAIEVTPDTLVTMANGKKHHVRESAEAVAALIEEYRARVLARSCGPLSLWADAPVLSDDCEQPEDRHA